MSLSNQKCMTQPTIFNLHPNEYTQCCNTVNYLSNKVCVSNKTEDLNIHVFNNITGINESKTLTKHLSCECKCKFDGK